MAETLTDLLGISGVALLFGELGAGKTALARAILRQYGYSGRVGSPTFDLVRRYHVEFGLIYHVDLYRLRDPGELSALDLPWIDPEDPNAPEGAVLIAEWAEMLRDHYPNRFEVTIALADPKRPERGRRYVVTAHGPYAASALQGYLDRGGDHP